MKKILFPFLFSSLVLSPPSFSDLLDELLKKGVITVGTTADYKPFTYKDGDHYAGTDIDVARKMAKALGVKLNIVETHWSTMIAGLNQRKFDIAMGGITRTLKRQLSVEQTQGYQTFGKCFLAAKGRGAEFDRLEKANKPSVKVGVNIGGTNEIFAKAHLPNATLVFYKNNLDVPEAVASGVVDIMITESPEARYYEEYNPKLSAVRADTPFTHSEFGYLVPKGEYRLLNVVNFMIEEETTFTR